jgi:hypothetical protein
MYPVIERERKQRHHDSTLGTAFRCRALEASATPLLVDNAANKHPITQKVRVSGTIKYVDMRPTEIRIPSTNTVEKRYGYDLQSVRFDRVEK